MSHLQYGILCWGRCKITVLQLIIRLFNTAIKCVNYCPFKETNLSKFYYKSNILNLNDIFKLELAKFMYKYNHNSLPNYFKPLFTTINTVHDHQTRAAKTNYFVPQRNSSIGKVALSYLEVRNWYEIPTFVKEKNCLHSFTNSYKKFLINQYIL